jgi:hypothetical protein
MVKPDDDTLKQLIEKVHYLYNRIVTLENEKKGKLWRKR